ncbi:uncharacterized protein N7473_006917 [Penicillium subrubescens]|uniref:Uncharacterized protein n=1 Tax=Penicillium subrubescens TaxID=1316194 RepID=A0A1Q5TFU6_9EURO|nr:uncharacterized protein N7473_006917 [Penicillium subrubescens]KAJ5890689.1 hypothetical protein N7473_006917 [Penicillium subrubescens]OKO99109.1 hypothetical protein PENSUB_8495 [Penicillium subrubescens]
MSLVTWPSYGSVTRWDKAEAVITHRRFHHYDENKEYVNDYEASMFLNIIIAQTHVRESTQREEALEENLEGQRKRMAIDPDNDNAKAEFEK